MKKRIAILLCVLIAFSGMVFSSCGGTGGNSNYQLILLSEFKESEDEDIVKLREGLTCFTEISDSIRNPEPYICILRSTASGDVTIPEYQEVDGERHPILLVTAESGALEDVTSLTFAFNYSDFYLENICGGDDSSSTLTEISFTGFGDTEKREYIKNCFHNLTAMKSFDLISDIDEMEDSFNGCSALEKYEDEYAHILNITDSFQNCAALESVDVGYLSHVDNCFTDCPVLTSVHLFNCNAISNTLNSHPALEKAVIDSEEVSDSFCDCPALTYAEIYEADKATNCFNNCAALQSISIAEAEEVMNCFNNCGTPESFLFGEIGSADTCFNDNTAATSLSLKGVLDYTNCFKNYSALKTLEVSGATYISDGSFDGCTALKDLTLTDDYWVCDSFQKCTSIEMLTTGNVRNISNLFNDCETLKSIAYAYDDYDKEGEARSNISGSFCQCKKLKTVQFTGAVQYIDQSFNDCSALTDVNYTYIYDIPDSFRNCKALKTTFTTQSQKDKEESEKIKKQYEELKAKEEAERKQKYANEPYGPGTSTLELKADNEKSACYRLERLDGTTEFKVFLDPGTSATRSFPSGRYILHIAEGKKWISDAEAFGAAGTYSATDIFTFASGATYQIKISEGGDFHSESSSGVTG